MSSRFDHPMMTFEPLAKGRLFCIVPEAHALARKSRISAADIVRHPLIGIDPNDPYGRIMAGIFARLGLTYEVTIKARFGTMVCALVGRGLGIAVIDEFTLAAGTWPNIVALPIIESTEFETFIAFRRDAILSSYCEHFIALLRQEMESLHAGKTSSGRKVTSGLRKPKS
jgi:DNA-binding transcriptional LysR family regulator